MKNELDLDELHQQVSKLMDQAQKPAPKKQSENPALSTSTSQPVKKEHPVTEKPVASPTSTAPTSVPVRRTTLQMPMRRRGIAMDVVQPTQVASAKPPSARASRMASEIKPTQNVVAEPPAPRAEPQVQPVEPTRDLPSVPDDALADLSIDTDKQKTADLPKHEAQPAPQNNSADFPDPLDVHGFSLDKPSAEEQQSTTLVDSNPAPPEAVAAPETMPPTMQPQAPPSANPFLNAKVEKRPLGAYAANQMPDAPHNDTESAETVANNSQLQHEKEPNVFPDAVSQPKELSPELVAIESAAPQLTQSNNEAQPHTDFKAMQVPKQYQTGQQQPNTNERPVFDTKEYHQPITTGAHMPGKSHAGIIFTLILVLVLLASLGVYFFMFGDIDLLRFI